jgi:hypothetical protein
LIAEYVFVNAETLAVRCALALPGRGIGRVPRDVVTATTVDPRRMTHRVSLGAFAQELLAQPLAAGCHTVSVVAKFKGREQLEGYTFGVRSHRAFDINAPKSITVQIYTTEEEAGPPRIRVMYQETLER